MSIHIPQSFLHGTAHSSNYLLNKNTSSSAISSGALTEIKHNFDKDTNNYFYSELLKILNTNATASEDKNTIVSVSNTANDVCLITQEKLHPNHVTLNCNHKFNYVPIYNEIVNQKNKQNNVYEITKLSYYQIKCPYCRSITNKLIPYIPYPSVRVIKNVNSYITTNYNKNPEYFLHVAKCSHGNNTDNHCQKYGIYYETENVLLCPQHYKLYTIKQKTGNKKNIKGVAKCSKTDGSKTDGSKTGCCAILKSGKNMGKMCGIKCAENISIIGNSQEMKYCKKHHNLYSNT
jgi:hypothetical protein